MKTLTKVTGVISALFFILFLANLILDFGLSQNMKHGMLIFIFLNYALQELNQYLETREKIHLVGPVLFIITLIALVVIELNR